MYTFPMQFGGLPNPSFSMFNDNQSSINTTPKRKLDFDQSPSLPILQSISSQLQIPFVQAQISSPYHHQLQQHQQQPVTIAAAPQQTISLHIPNSSLKFKPKFSWADDEIESVDSDESMNHGDEQSTANNAASAISKTAETTQNEPGSEAVGSVSGLNNMDIQDDAAKNADDQLPEVLESDSDNVSAIESKHLYVPNRFTHSEIWVMLWPVLQSKGWKYVPGDAFHSWFYLMPNIQKKDGVIGKTMFPTPESIIYFLEKNDTSILDEATTDLIEMEQRRKKEPEQKKQEIEELTKIEPEHTVPKKIDNPDKELIKSKIVAYVNKFPFSKMNQRLSHLIYDASWKEMKEKGWNAINGRGLISWVYIVPGATCNDGIPDNESSFGSINELVSFWLQNEPYKSAVIEEMYEAGITPDLMDAKMKSVSNKKSFLLSNSLTSPLSTKKKVMKSSKKREREESISKPTASPSKTSDAPDSNLSTPKVEATEPAALENSEKPIKSKPKKQKVVLLDQNISQGSKEDDSIPLSVPEADLSKADVEEKLKAPKPKKQKIITNNPSASSTNIGNDKESTASATPKAGLSKTGNEDKPKKSKPKKEKSIEEPSLTSAPVVAATPALTIASTTTTVDCKKIFEGMVFDFTSGSISSKIASIIESRGGKFSGTEKSTIATPGNSLSSIQSSYVISAPLDYGMAKYLETVAKGVPCIHYQWIVKSHEADKLLPWFKFILPSGMSALRNSFVFLESWSDFINPASMGQETENIVPYPKPIPQHKRVLQGYKVHLVGKAKENNENQSLFQVAGAKIVASLDQVDSNTISICDEDDKLVESFNECKQCIEKGATIATMEWLKICIADGFPHEPASRHFQRFKCLYCNPSWQYNLKSLGDAFQSDSTEGANKIKCSWIGAPKSISQDQGKTYYYSLNISTKQLRVTEGDFVQTKTFIKRLSHNSFITYQPLESDATENKSSKNETDQMIRFARVKELWETMEGEKRVRLQEFAFDGSKLHLTDLEYDCPTSSIDSKFISIRAHEAKNLITSLSDVDLNDRIFVN